jgi:quercetin dioxygenase-like cupin family protein
MDLKGNSELTLLLDGTPLKLPDPAHAMTVLIELPPGDLGSPPHRHSGPVYGYMIEEEMIFELEGELFCVPGEPMLTYVDDEELAARRDRRAPRS